MSQKHGATTLTSQTEVLNNGGGGSWGGGVERKKEREITIPELLSRITRLIYIPLSPQCRATVLGNVRWPRALAFGL